MSIGGIGQFLGERETANDARYTCPKCEAPEVAANTPYTVYKCGSHDYDQRPGTFKQTMLCSANETIERLERENAELRKQITDWEELEASCCPEDFGFDEVIASLRKQLATAREQERERCIIACQQIEDDYRIARDGAKGEEAIMYDGIRTGADACIDAIRTLSNEPEKSA